jgi:hypothetical protein
MIMQQLPGIQTEQRKEETFFLWSMTYLCQITPVASVPSTEKRDKNAEIKKNVRRPAKASRVDCRRIISQLPLSVQYAEHDALFLLPGVPRMPQIYVICLLILLGH